MTTRRYYFISPLSSYNSSLKILSLILFSAVCFFGCEDSAQQPSEKVDRLMQQAVTEMNRQNYDDAERLLAESIDLNSESNNEAKLAENYSTLSSIQLLSGKLSPGLETLIALRDIYQRSGDRSAELQTMIQIGRVNFQLGRSEHAFSILTEAYNNSTLFLLDQIAISSAISLSTLYSKTGKYEKALLYATNAYQTSKRVRNIFTMIESQHLRVSALTALGNISKAFEIFREAETIVLSEKTANAEQFYLQCGKAFAFAEEWPFAKRNFERAIDIAEHKQGELRSQILIEANIGIAELYAHHFAFPDAQRFFVQAYHVAKERSDNVTLSYLLIRVADCLAQQSSVIESQDGLIRATQLYEQAQTLFSRTGFSFGEAITLHRLGMLKERSGDDNAAITFYKRAYDRFIDQQIDPKLCPLIVPIELLYQSESTKNSPVEWFSQNLISLLLRNKKTEEAFSYLQSVRNITLQTKLYPLSLHFRDQLKESKFSALHNSMLMYRQNLLELHNINSMQQQTKNRNYANKLQKQIAYFKSKMQSDAVTIAQAFPVFSFLSISHRSPQSGILNAIPKSQAVLDFFFANNEAWVIIAKADEEVAAVKLSSYGYALENKMRQYCDMLYSFSGQSADVRRLSNELYEFFIKPIDLTGIQRIVIIPPLQFEHFPFHSLTNDGISILEKTGVTYLPHAGVMTATLLVPKFINSIAAFGFTSNSRWGLEFELRDIRSFFRNTQININQAATKQKLVSSVGEVVQISTFFTRDKNNDSWFTLSDGSTSKAGISVPIAEFTEIHPFQIVYLSDAQSTVNNVTNLHPLLWLLNGSTCVVATHFPITPNISKTFGENFYSSLSSEVNPFLAYRRAAVYLGKKKELNSGYGGSSYFYYGVK